MKYKYNWT